MNQVVVFYNPFLPELKISINGKKLSPYSSLMSYQHQRLEKWCGRLLPELYREVNSDYELLCISNEFACAWLGELACRDSHCLGFSGQPLPLKADIYERLAKLELLGCDESSVPIRIPVVNASGDGEMTSAVFALLEEQGIFGRHTEDSLFWNDCPFAAIQLQACRPSEISPEAPFVAALCASEEDPVRLDTDVPVYALVMGTKTRFLGRQENVLLFTVDPDDLGDLILHLLEEEALSPLLSRLSYCFPEDAMDLLLDSEQEELALICQGAPICRVEIPQILDMGRPVQLCPQILPADCAAELHVVSDQPCVIEARDGGLYPRAPGAAEISVYLGEDPYPAASGLVKVRQRTLIDTITLFPHALCMPINDSAQLQVSVSPDDAENVEEISWESSDSAIAEVDPSTGVITAKACGQCSITAYTQESSCCVSLEVQPELEEILFPGSFLELNAGEQREWRYEVRPPNAFGADTLRVASSDKNIAEYRGGYILGKSPGECKIYVQNQSGSVSRTLRVTVRKGKGLW